MSIFFIKQPASREITTQTISFNGSSAGASNKFGAAELYGSRRCHDFKKR
jgi:hypothetical protein